MLQGKTVSFGTHKKALKLATYLKRQVLQVSVTLVLHINHNCERNAAS